MFIFLSSPVYVCSPRGELSKHALAIKPFRKMLYCILTLPFWIRKFSFIASSEKEKIEILNSLKISPIRCAVLPEPTLKYVQTFFVPQKKSGELKIIFMARINRIKNLDFAISCVAECENVSLDIYGPINSNEEQIYWKECKKLIDKNNLASRVRYHGPAASESVHGLISCAHVLFAPSSSENFGHSILESLSCGRPVLISDQTPWTSVQENGAGFAFSLKNTNAFIKSLNYLKELKHEDFLNLCKNALRCSTELYSQEGASLTWLDYSDEMLSRPTIKGFGPE